MTPVTTAGLVPDAGTARFLLASAISLLVTLAPTPAAALQADTAPPAGRVVADTAPAPALAGNLLGDPTRQPVWVYLPPGYDRETARRYPTLYLLHGVLDDPSVWFEPAYQGMTIQATVDSLVAAGEIEPLIVVMPNGRNALGGSYYLDSPVTGGWGEFVARDLVDHVDRVYRTLPAAEARAIAGHSMGGYGAIRAGMMHPETFSVVYAMNPCCLCCLEAETFPQPVDLDAYPSIEALWAELERGNIWPLVIASAAAAFSPNPARPPFYGDVSLVIEDGRAVPDSAVMERWRAAYPLGAIARRADDLRRLRGLALDSAFGDQFAHIPPSTAAFSDSLEAHRIPHLYEVYEGDHRNRMRERMATRILPWISARLAPPSPPSGARDP